MDVKARVHFSISAELRGTDVAVRPSPRRHLNTASGQKLAHVLAARYDLFYFTRSRKLQLHAVEVIKALCSLWRATNVQKMFCFESTLYFCTVFMDSTANVSVR